MPITLTFTGSGTIKVSLFIQVSILRINSYQILKVPGGRLAYATCYSDQSSFSTRFINRSEATLMYHEYFTLKFSQ